MTFPSRTLRDNHGRLTSSSLFEAGWTPGQELRRDSSPRDQRRRQEHRQRRQPRGREQEEDQGVHAGQRRRSARRDRRRDR